MKGAVLDELRRLADMVGQHVEPLPWVDLLAKPVGDEELPRPRALEEAMQEFLDLPSGRLASS